MDVSTIASTDDESVIRMEDAPEVSKKDTILTLVYTKKETLVRRFFYGKSKETDRPNFMDKGWVADFNIDSRSVFANPYKR